MTAATIQRVCPLCGGADQEPFLRKEELRLAQCGSCRMGAAFSVQALEVLRMVLGGNLRAALDLEESVAVNEANQVVMAMMEAHLERRIRSLGVFDRHL